MGDVVSSSSNGVEWVTVWHALFFVGKNALKTPYSSNRVV